MKELINRKDRNGIQLREGDIVAECSVGDVIWDGKGVITSRPLGVVIVYPSVKDTAMCHPEETDRYNVAQYRCGLVELTELADDWLPTIDVHGHKFTELHLSKYDGNFYAWDNIERIGSVYDLDVTT